MDYYIQYVFCIENEPVSFIIRQMPVDSLGLHVSDL